MSNIPNDQLPTPIRPGGSTPPPPPSAAPPPPPSASPQPTPYGQPGAYGQPAPYGQPGAYGQPGVYGQPGAYGQPAAPGWTVPAPPGGTVPGAPTPGRSNPRRTWMIAGAVAVVIAAAVGIGIAVTSGNDDPVSRPDDTEATDDTDAPGGGSSADDLTTVYSVLWGRTPSSTTLDCLTTETNGMEAAIGRSASGVTQPVAELKQVLAPYLYCTPTDDSLPMMRATVTNAIGNVDQTCVDGVWQSMTIDDVSSALAIYMSDAATYQQWVTTTFGGC